MTLRSDHSSLNIRSVCAAVVIFKSLALRLCVDLRSVSLRFVLLLAGYKPSWYLSGRTEFTLLIYITWSWRGFLLSYLFVAIVRLLFREIGLVVEPRGGFALGFLV